MNSEPPGALIARQPPNRSKAGIAATYAGYLTCLAAEVSANVIMAKTGHKSLRSVAPYVNPASPPSTRLPNTLSSPRRCGL